MKSIVVVSLLLLVSPVLGQQVPLGGSQPYAPNMYNRQSQPLSPYLNLLRGGNPAVNYFYGVRPGQQSGAFSSPFLGSMGAQGRQTFFPQIDNLYELDDVSPQDGLRATGHPFGFNNTLGFFGGTMGGGGSNQQRTSNQQAMSPKRSSMSKR